MAAGTSAGAGAGAGAVAGVGTGGKAKDDGLVSLVPGFRFGLFTVIFGLVVGLIVVGIIYLIYYTGKTNKLLIFLSIIVVIIFVVCIKKAPRAYMFSVLSVLMLIGAMGFGFILDLPFPFRIAAGCMALVAGIMKVYFY